MPSFTTPNEHLRHAQVINTTPKCRSQNETAPGQLNPVPRLTTDQIPLRKPLSRKDRAATPSHLQRGQRAASIRDYLERKEREEKKPNPHCTTTRVPVGAVLARDPYRRVESRASQMRNWRAPIGALDRGNRAARQAAIPDDQAAAVIPPTLALVRRQAKTPTGLPKSTMIAQRVGIAALRRGTPLPLPRN